MDKSKIMLLLNLLNMKLRERNMEIELNIVGGSALILNGYARSTIDIDTVSEEVSNISDIIQEIADETGEPADWLNNEAGGLASEKFYYSEVIEFSNLKCYVANDEYLLATKIRAGRDQDIRDAKWLMSQLQISKKHELKDIFNKYYNNFYNLDKINETISQIMSKKEENND